MTKEQLEEEIRHFRKIFQEIRLFPIGNISDIDEDGEKSMSGRDAIIIGNGKHPVITV
mgnify:CR=1 FL=1